MKCSAIRGSAAAAAVWSGRERAVGHAHEAPFSFDNRLIRLYRRYAVSRHSPFGLNPNLTEIAMLTPILTVKTSAVAAQAAAVAETATPTEQAPAIPLRISGNQSEAVLKILETLNRHLIGSEPLPKEALIRLLDTLAKILKFPPLPQESLRDFTKRLAVFLETLPPAARLALEKQLGQRDLAVSIRILAEALKGPSLIDAPRLLEKFFTPTAVARPVASQPDGRPAAVQPVPHGQGTVAGRPMPLPMAQQLLAAPATISDPGLLQAALKKAFGDEEEIVTPVVVAEENETEPSILTATREDRPAQASRGNSMTAAGAQQQSAKANSETIPLLRAAAAFLAADPEALSLVAAIAAGDVDSEVITELEQQLGLSEQSEEPEKPISFSPNSDKPTSAAQASRPEKAAVAPSQAEPSFERQPASLKQMEVDGFAGHDLGEWELETGPDQHSSASTSEAYFMVSDQDHPEKDIAQTLKALVEATLPLPEGAEDVASNALFSALAGETADMGAESLFAELEAQDEAVMVAEAALLTGDVAEQADLPTLDADAWSSVFEAPKEKTANRAAFAHPQAMEEHTREAQLQRPAETAIARDAIPFAMIPYLPAKTAEGRSIIAEDEEQPAFAGNEERDGRGDGGDEPDERDEQATGANSGEERDETETADAYDLYKHMGGLG
jgi:hypothetical protein